jgi:hypothetical protein
MAVFGTAEETADKGLIAIPAEGPGLKPVQTLDLFQGAEVSA